MAFTPEFPDKELTLELLSKVHDKDIPNWTTKEQEEAYIQLQALTFYFFRTEVINNE